LLSFERKAIVAGRSSFEIGKIPKGAGDAVSKAQMITPVKIIN
jgi:hypothetical protein